MAPETILAELIHRGVDLVAVGDRLRYRPSHVVTSNLKQALVVHKPELMAMLHQLDVQPLRTGTWGRCASALLALIEGNEERAGLREFFEERAGIGEHLGQLSVDEAERLAFAQLRELVTRRFTRHAAQEVSRS